MPRVVRAAGVDASAIEVEEAVEQGACPGDEHRARAEPPEQVGAQRPPESQREHDDQQPGEIRADPVVDPGAVGGERPEVGESSFAKL
jgi:hypothetical protein